MNVIVYILLLIIIIIFIIALNFIFNNNTEGYLPEKYILSENVVSENSVWITGYNYSKKKHEVDISLQTFELPVTYITTEAFKKKKLISVTFPNSLTGIGKYAFANNKLKEVSIPDGVVIIREYAFANNQIINIKMGENVKLEEGAFDNCFVQFYQNNDKKAGQYIYENGNWEMK